MAANYEPVYYQLLSGEVGASSALSAPPGPNPGGNLVNAALDDSNDRQLWELVANLVGWPDEFRVAIRNKATGFVAAAPVGDNTWGVTQEGFDPGNDSAALLWTFVPTGDSRWAIRPAGRQNQNLNAMSMEIGSEVAIWGMDSGHPSDAWSVVADFDYDPEGRQ